MKWKKNFRKMPPNIAEKLGKINSDNIAVVSVKQIKREDIENDDFAHLRISLGEDGLRHPESIIPDPRQGIYSSWNVNGKEIVRKDLPKETHYNVIEAPNWGDPSRGTHTVYLPYKKYPRDFVPPRHAAIEIESYEKSPDLPVYILKFQVSEILNRNTPDFEERLFFALNMLQENVGSSDVAAAGTPFNEYVKTLHVTWNILPPGTIDDVVSRLFPDGKITEHDKNTITERYEFFLSLKPVALVFGESGFQRYFGAMIKEDLVIFENDKYGNAIYVMYSNWKELSQKSRVELLSGKYGKEFDRVVHKGNWQKRVRRIIKMHTT